jgi:hypothetical protein
MTVFVAASDESTDAKQQGLFYRAGFVAPAKDWFDWFVPAWEERVLVGPPPIPYLHMTDIRSRSWRDKHGLSGGGAERRLDEAFRVIASMGSIFPIGSEIEHDHIKRSFRGIAVRGRTKPQKRIYKMEPDYLAFLTFANAVLLYVHIHHPECDKVDFLIERSGTVTDRIRDFHHEMAGSLERTGQPELTECATLSPC